MADQPKTEDLPLAANGEVKAYDRLGNKITVPKDQVGQLYGMGGRVAARAEVQAQQLEDDYAKKGTIEKIAGYATPALPAPVQMALRGAGVAPMPPELEAYRSGASQAFSGGLEGIVTKEGVELAAGKQAAHDFGQKQLALKEAHAGLYSAGEVAGFVGGAVAGGAGAGLGRAGAAIPSVGIGAVGNLAERGAARALAGVAERGAIGRALATGGGLAARGAVEGALYSGASQITEDMLGDRSVAADKVFASMGTGALYGGAGGAVLGAAGSLAASGARGAMTAARSGIGRALSRAESVAGSVERGAGALAAAGDQATIEARGIAGDAAAEARHAVDKAGVQAENAARAGVAGTAQDTAASAKGIAEVTGTKLDQEAGASRSWFEKAASKDAQQAVAQEQAWKAIGAGNGLQSTSFAKSAERYLPNGVKDVGEVILRKGIINAEDGVINAMRHGTPAAMLPKIDAELQIVGKKIGDITAASPAQITGIDIGEAVGRVARKYEESAATRPAGRALRGYGEALRDSLGLTSMDGNVAVQDLIRERKALDKMVFENAALDPSLTVQVKRELRSELEGLIVKGMDDASGQLPGMLKAEYKALKHDYTALSIASEAAEDSAARMEKAATFGLTDTLRGGGSVAKTIGSKVIRERGNAAAAVLLTRMADMGTITRAMRAVDEQLGKASKGLLAAPKARPLPEPPSTEPLRARAQRVMDRVATMQADPERYANLVAQHVEPLNNSAPGVAGELATRMTSAAAFMAARIPVHADPDPFDPHPAARLTDSQAATVVKYDAYLQRPMLFFEELEHGKMTPEGVEVIRELMPGTFAELQQRTVEGLADLMAQGKKPPFAQRERLGVLLGIPAVPSQRPEHMRLLQANVANSGKEPKPPQHGAPVQPPRRPIATKSQPSTLDRLEGR